jgi:hypothetical protein
MRNLLSLQAMPTSRKSSSTAPLCGPSSKPPAHPKNDDQAIGRSHGGLTNKIHALVDGLGMLARFRLTGWRQPRRTAFARRTQTCQSGCRHSLRFERDPATSGSGGHSSRRPPSSNRLEQGPLEQHLYASRNLVERVFCPHQAIPADRHPVRQTLRTRLLIRCARRYFHLDLLIVITLQ